MENKFSVALKEVFFQHFGGLIGGQLFSRELIKFEISDLDSLSEETKKLFVQRLVNDCFGEMVSEEKRKQIEKEFLDRVFKSEAKEKMEEKAAEKKAQIEKDDKPMVFMRKDEITGDGFRD
jgi:hypothetical protein